MWNPAKFADADLLRRSTLFILIVCLNLLMSFSIQGQTESNVTTNTSSAPSIVKIGNPGMEQFPKINGDDCFARSVWDMHSYNGRIYVGLGDYWSNRGPIDVWSFDSEGEFRKEYRADEEQVLLFREYGGKLFIPGIDSKGPSGNFYVNDNGIWQKSGPVPNAVHVYDIAIFEQNTYVTISSNTYSQLLRSPDMGQSWHSVSKMNWDKGAAVFAEALILGDDLVIMGTNHDRQPCLYRYTDDDVEALLIPLFPGSNRSVPNSKAIRFKDGIIYIGQYAVATIYSPSSLIFLNDLDKGAIVIEKFRQKSVRDIIVRDSVCYVLTASQSGTKFLGRIHSSSNLEDWIELAEFSVPALPYSFELLDGSFYIGLGKGTASVNPSSGDIYKLELSADNAEPPAWDVDGDGTTGILDILFIGHYIGQATTEILDPNPDVNRDGQVNILDVAIVGRHFGEVYSFGIPPADASNVILLP